MRLTGMTTLLLAALLAGLPAQAGTLTLTRVWPEKIVYRPGEKATIRVDVANTGAATQAVTVEAYSW